MSILKINTYFKVSLLAIALSGAGISFAQSNLRIKNITLNKDTIQLDSLSIIPGTISIKKQNGESLDTAVYKIDYVNALLILSSYTKLQEEDSFVISYTIFPFLFSRKYQHKDISNIQNNQFGEIYTHTYDKSRDVDFFKTEGLTKSGSISRGISFGNNQDVVLNSNLNLQLAGRLSDNMDILLAATDQNIPIQPDGNTQQLQEFDKVFIQIGIKDLPKSGKTIVTAGDFQIGKPNGYFMNFNKKLQGLSFETNFPPPNTQSLFKVKASAAVSKGKFSRNISTESSNGNTFNGQKQERNQGPYKLRGSENEQFIIVLAGTETVYLEGQLLERGQENDYVIDYNTSEIVFTPKQPITKDKRIVVEFQYSDKNYSRSLTYAGTEYDAKKMKTRINIYSEQDNKNRPLQQELDDPQKILLSSIGDSLHNALWPSADSVAFNSTEVLYDKKDSLTGTFLYTGIYVYSADSSKAHYSLNFSYVGTNKGNYRLKQSSANGKVHEWVLPDTITGLPRGSYEPVTLLITPKKKQMVSAGADFILGKNSKLYVEGALSNNDINTFSEIGKANDAGFAGKLNWDNRIPISRPPSLSVPQTSLQPKQIGQDSDSTKKTQALSPEGKNVLKDSLQVEGWLLLTNVNYEYIQQTFSPIERFRNVEFERDWNRGSTFQSNDQHIIGGRIGLARKENIIAYDHKSLLEGTFYNGRKHAAKIHLGAKGFLFSADGSYLDSKSSFNTTNFLRHNAFLSKYIPLRILRGGITVGIREQQEQNLIRATTIDSLIAGSIQFTEWEPYAEFKDSSNNKYTINYKQRVDYALKNLTTSELHKATYAENIGGAIELMNNSNSQFRVTGSYRTLKILDTAITFQKPENTVIGRVEYNFSLLKGFFSSGTFYEVGSGLEVRKEFVFLEVASGQGTHIWNTSTDYNANGIKELNEFEIALANEGNYIKVWVPTDDYISTYTNQFSEVVTVNPSAKWVNKKGIRKIASRFSNQTAYRTDRKTTNADLVIAYNPFLSDAKDNTLVMLNSSFRNTIYFNQTGAVFGMDFTWQDIQNKTVLVNDTTFRSTTSRETKARWNLNRQWTLQGSYKDGVKQNDSKFFTTRNYYIEYFEAEPQVNFQPNGSFRINLSYKYSEKENTISTSVSALAKVTAQNFGSELKFNALNKGSLNVKVNFIQIAYNDAENSPLAYEMLEGLKTGKNYTWNVGYSRTLASNIQLTLSYDGRQSPGIKTIHTGNAQVRAFF